MNASSTASSPPPLQKASPHSHPQNYDKSLPAFPLPLTNPSTSSRTSSSSSRVRTHNPLTAKQLVRLLAAEQDTTHDLQQDLSQLTSQLAFEQDRADAAERKAIESVTHLKGVNDVRLAAQADVVRLTKELKSYKDALELAQKEIFKAQNVLQEVEGRRRDAEEEASSLRRKLRKINEEKMIEMAREEGRKQGVQEGLEMGKDIGYLHGRNKGYVNGRLTADRMVERYFSPPSQHEIRRSRGEPDLPSESEPPYTATTTRFPPSGDSAPSSSSSSSEREVSLRAPTRVAQTASARTTMYSPAHPHVEIPQDGFIPEADASMIIRLPPPHELMRLPSTPDIRSPISSKPNSPSPRLAPVPIPGDVPVLMVPEPRSPRNPLHEPPSERQRHRIRRRSSGESIGSSTRTSELDLLNAPDHVANRGHRASGLSAIPEVTSLQEASTPSSRSLKQNIEDCVDEAGFVHVSMPAPRTPAEMAGSKIRRSPSQSLSVDQREFSRRGSTSSFGTVNITIQPPSRPASNNSSATGSGTRPYLLSPADADRPVPLPPSSQQTPTTAPLTPTGSTVLMNLPDGGLPPGFVPMGVETPFNHGAGSSYTGAGVPLPPSSVGTYHHRLSSLGSYMGDPDTPIVIPSPSGKYAQESDDSSSDADTLTTPPGRYRVPSSGGYMAAGVPLPSSGYTAAGMTLPPSSVAGTPYSYGRSPGSEALYVNMNAGVTPAALGRTKSFSTDRGTLVRA
ncbi:hypothetical protein PAXRUDRAFT_831086 [Paxillus rubicundulus Ve08.2h10]|uniref:Uncharacterized protein n=1 Tax=Paxillus rubicundulus Ve08.2h10 TaxID=930991 RepID=A0A0D0E2Q1_9AGAM|nr:hypothetical protein PAXRUDRAFT_831086 [Paxillus rubicundulus Ve08.2h10]